MIVVVIVVIIIVVIIPPHYHHRSHAWTLPRCASPTRSWSRYTATASPEAWMCALVRTSMLVES